MTTSRVMIMGENDSGNQVPIPCDTNGHLEVAIHSPRLPFGSVHVENLTPIFQHDAVYGVNPIHITATTGGTGTATANDSAYVCTTGTTIYSSGTIQSRKRLIYRPGQGVIARFTGLFSTPVASSYQVIGVGHAEDGLFFGYKGTQFGIIYNNRGKREVQTLTVSAGSTHNENVTVTLGGVAHTIAVTNSGSTIKTAYEISIGTYTGWKAEQVGATVVFVADSVGNKTGTFSVSGTSAAGTFAETQAGQAVTETFIPQSSWNGDRMDGTGNSGVTIDPTKFNVFQIGVQYLGAGALVFQIEAAYAGNNPDWITVHTALLPNTLTASSFGNPVFPFTMSAYSAGSTTDLTVKCASFAGFIEGEKKLHGDRLSYFAQSTGVGASNYQALMSIRNTRYYGGRTNQSVINLLSIGGALKHTSPCTIYVFRNATLAGTPNFSQYAVSSSTYVDTSATTCTIASNNQLIWSGTLGDTGNFSFPFSDEITIEPGETITIAAKASTGSPSYVIASLNTREDQ